MTPEPDARCVVTRSALRGSTPSPGAYDVVKISTTDGATTFAALSSAPLKSAMAAAERAGAACAAATLGTINTAIAATACNRRTTL